MATHDFPRHARGESAAEIAPAEIAVPVTEIAASLTEIAAPLTEIPELTRRSAFRLGGLIGVGTLGTLTAVGCTAHGSTETDPDAATGRKEVVVALADIPVGGAVSATIKRRPVVIGRPKDDEVIGFSARCTHQGCTVRPNGDRFDCPCHGSWFSAFTGEVLRGPAQLPLNPVDVEIDGPDVVAS